MNQDLVQFILKVSHVARSELVEAFLLCLSAHMLWNRLQVFVCVFESRGCAVSIVWENIGCTRTVDTIEPVQSVVEWRYKLLLEYTHTRTCMHTCVHTHTHMHGHGHVLLIQDLAQQSADISYNCVLTYTMLRILTMLHIFQRICASNWVKIVVLDSLLHSSSIFNLG